MCLISLIMELGGTRLVVLIFPQNTSEELNSSVSVYEIMTRLLKITIWTSSVLCRTFKIDDRKTETADIPLVFQSAAHVAKTCGADHYKKCHFNESCKWLHFTIVLMEVT